MSCISRFPSCALLLNLQGNKSLLDFPGQAEVLLDQEKQRFWPAAGVNGVLPPYGSFAMLWICKV